MVLQVIYLYCREDHKSATYQNLCLKSCVRLLFHTCLSYMKVIVSGILRKIKFILIREKLNQIYSVDCVHLSFKNTENFIVILYPENVPSLYMKFKLISYHLVLHESRFSCLMFSPHNQHLNHLQKFCEYIESERKILQAEIPKCFLCLRKLSVI